MTSEGNRDPDEWFATSTAQFARFGRLIEAVGTATPEEHARHCRALLDDLPRHEAERDQLHRELTEVLRTVDARELLMQFSIPYLHIDPNTWRESASDQLPAHVEYLALQVLGLRQTTDPVPAEASDPRAVHSALFEVERLVRGLFDVEGHLVWARTLLDPESGLTEAERWARARMLNESISVRNSQYSSHTREIATGLLSPLGARLERLVGFTVEDAFAVYDSLGELLYEPIYSRIQDALVDYQELLTLAKRARRKKSLPDSPQAELARRLAKLAPSKARDEVQGLAATWGFHGARDTTALTADRVAGACGVPIEKVRRLLQFFAVSEDEFDDRYHRFPCPTHPLQLRPLLPDRDGWILPIPGNLLSALLPAIEDAIEADGRYWEHYAARRGRYLEEQTRRLLTRSLQGSRSWARLNWNDGEHEGELDGLVEYGDATLLVQCKAGRVSAAARRGGIPSMRTSLERLVGEAVDQHSALRKALKDQPPTAVGLGDHQQRLHSPLRFEIVVTLDDLTTFSTEAYQLREFGTLAVDEPIPWIVSLGDLHVVCDLLENTSLIHYLTRRVKLNRLGRVSAHDELDWVGHYLSEGLFFDDIFARKDAPHVFRLLSYTDPIDAWYFAEEGGRTVPTERPRQKRPPAVTALLARLERERPRNFVLACCLLRDWSSESTEDFESELLAARARAEGQGWASLTLVFPGYGFSWVANLSDLAGLVEQVHGLAHRRREPEAQRPLWVALGDDPRVPLVLSVRADSPVLRAVEDALFEPLLGATKHMPSTTSRGPPDGVKPDIP